MPSFARFSPNTESFKEEALSTTESFREEAFSTTESFREEALSTTEEQMPMIDGCSGVLLSLRVEKRRRRKVCQEWSLCMWDRVT